MIPTSKMMFITSEDKVICKGTDRKMPRYDHEEADTPIIVHVRDSLQRSDNHVISVLLIRMLLLSLSGSFTAFVN